MQVPLQNMEVMVGRRKVFKSKELLLYLARDGPLKDGVNGVMTYKGGSSHCK